MSTFGMILTVVFSCVFASIPIFFTAWALARAFRVKDQLKLLGQIKGELKAINDNMVEKQSCM